MTEPALAIEPKLRLAGLLLLCGLVVAIVTLTWSAPLSFLVFSGIGGPFIFAGIVVYLFSLTSLDHN